MMPTCSCLACTCDNAQLVKLHLIAAACNYDVITTMCKHALGTAAARIVCEF